MSVSDGLMCFQENDIEIFLYLNIPRRDSDNFTEGVFVAEFMKNT